MIGTPTRHGTTRRHRPTRRAAVALVAAGAVAAGLTGCGATTAAAAVSTPATTASPHLITVAGTTINALCTGAVTSRPTVILVAGLPDPLTKFTQLQKALSKQGRVCSYDRPGEGASPAATSTQSLASTATLLDGVLRAEKVHGKVVVVGHSLGGLLAAQFTHQYPKRVAGLVLLDATAPSVGPALEALIPASSTGALAEIRGEATSFSSPNTNPEKLVYTGAPIGSLGRTPLTVVQHGKLIYAPVPLYGIRMQQIWAAGQRQLAGLSTNSRMVTATTSGHYIYLDQQALTIRLIDHATDH